MTKTRLSKRIIAVIVVMALTVLFAVQAFAGAWIFGTGGSGANAFAPRGYSIAVSGVDTWMDSDYDHDGTVSGGQPSATYIGDNLSDPNYVDPETEVRYVSASTSATIRAWFDKNPQGSTLPGTVSKTYRDFVAVKIDGGSMIPLIDLPTYNNAYSVTVGTASRITDPDGATNQWQVPITMNLISGHTYQFVFLRGLEAKNGISCVLYPSVTDDDDAFTGVIGYINNSNYTSAESAEYASHYADIYQYVDISRSNTQTLGIDANNNTVYSVVPLDFIHTIVVS